MKRFIKNLLWALSLLFIGTTVVAAGTLDSMLGELNEPRIASDEMQLDGFKMHMGRTVFELDGKAAIVKAGDDAVGFVFSGEGKLTTTVGKGPFRQANLTNLKEEIDPATAKKGAYSDTFDMALFLLNRMPEEISGPPGSGEGPMQEFLSTKLEQWRLSPYPGLDFLLAEQLLNRLPGKTAVVFTEGGHRDLLYMLDEAEEKIERLGRWKKARGSKKVFIMSSIMSQGAGFDPRIKPTPSLWVRGIDLELVSPDNEMLDETTVLDVKAGPESLTLLTFDLVNGKSERFDFWDQRQEPFTVDSVSTLDGKALQFAHKYDRLLVLLPEILAPGEHLKLRIHAKGNLLKNFFGDNYTVLGNMAYYPQLNTEATMASFHATVKVRDPWVAVACGKNLRRWKEEQLNCLESNEERPVSFPFVIVGNFKESGEEKGGYDLKVYSYSGAKKRGTRNLLRNGLAILDFYSHGMVPFPYHELELVEIPYYRHFFWQSPAGIVEITSEGFNPVAADSSDTNSLIKRYAKKGQNARLAHEIAHQWFGNLVSWATPQDNWLSESFAEYLSYLFMTKGAKKSSKAREQFKQWKIDVDECSEESSIYGATALAGGSCYTQLLYGKGPYVLHALRKDMGDEKFTRLLFFLTKAAGEKKLKVSTEDVIQFASAIGGKDYRPFFDRYVFGTEVPEIKE